MSAIAYGRQTPGAAGFGAEAGRRSRVRLVRRLEPGHPHLKGGGIDYENVVALQGGSRIGDDVGQRQKEPVVGASSVELTGQQLTDSFSAGQRTADRESPLPPGHRGCHRYRRDRDVVVGVHFGGKAVDVDDPRAAAGIDTGGGRTPATRKPTATMASLISLRA